MKPQLVVFLDGNQFKAEICQGSNRRVINLPKRNWEEELRPLLEDLKWWLQDQEDRKARTLQEAEEKCREAEIRFKRNRHVKNWETTGQQFGESFAKKTIGDKKRAPRQPIDLAAAFGE